MRSLRRALLFFILLSLLCSVGCRRTATVSPPKSEDVIERTDFTSVYEMIGNTVTVDMVEEDENGLAYVTLQGKRYELGMDFLSKAMVYNTDPPSDSDTYASAEEVFCTWWRLYIQRWNYLVPEIPLYSNRYYDLYNAKLQNFVTTPYRSPADAIVGARVKDGEPNTVILGSSTELSGAFRNAAWGKSSAGAADLDVESLTTGHATVMTDAEGSYLWNLSALAEKPIAERNEDGSLTYTITLQRDLKFSDGSPIRAEHYLSALLASSTPVASAAGGSGRAGMYFLGFDAFSAYTGLGETVFFEGVRLLDDYRFSLTVSPAYANYYYAISYATLTPTPLSLYLGDGKVITRADGACGLDPAFYATEMREGRNVYQTAARITENLKWSSPFPYSGPYFVQNYDVGGQVATLARNPYYTGDDVRGVPSIDTLTYIRLVTETQIDQFTTGQVDVISGITGATETLAALSVVRSDPQKYAETHYDRAGYGKLGFRADFGPTSFTEVRQAIMYTVNRPEFAQTFTGGYGSVVHGPYYTGYAAYRAVKDQIHLNRYAYSVDSAMEALESGGWIYNADGTLYNTHEGGIRYKRLEGYARSFDNLSFSSTDGAYRTQKAEDGEYYMPLVINYFGTQPNTVTDQLLTAWVRNPSATEEIGMYITYTSTDFNTGLFAELHRLPAYGYDGKPKLNAINFATGFTSAAYDYAEAWTIDPALYDNYSQCYLRDEADFWLRDR